MNTDSISPYVILFVIIIIGECIDYLRPEKGSREENIFYTTKKRRIVLSLFAIAFFLLFLVDVMDLHALKYIGASLLLITGVINVFFMWKEYKFVGIFILALILFWQYLQFFFS